MSKEQLILLGGGGHCRSCIDVIDLEDRFTIAGIVDTREKVGERVLGYKIIACDDDLALLAREYRHFFITLGYTNEPDRRMSLYKKIISCGATLATVVSPQAYVARSATIGIGTIVMHGAVINTSSNIGNNCIVNSQALVEHDVEIGDHCHISTGAVVNGACNIGEACFIGSRCVLIHGVDITSRTLIGAGSVVTKSISLAGTYIGVPAKKLKQMF